MYSKTTKKIIAVISCVLVLCFAFAGCAMTGTTADGATADSATTTSSMLTTILPLVLLFAIFYFFMIRPENKKKKKVEEMRNSLSVGDKITTIGGIVGEIVSVSSDKITIETGEDRVRVQFAKWAISNKDK